MKNKIRVGIIGGAGYTAGELLRLLINHPMVEIAYVHSSSNAGNKVCSVHEGLWGDTDLTFSSSYDLGSIDLLFLCSAHGQSRRFWLENHRPSHLKVIDLAQDYRDESDGYTYGLPELQQQKIEGSSLIANPGCFATAIELALLPLAAAGKLSGEVHVTAITGSTGAGVKPSEKTHFSWRNNNISVYKAFSHQHLAEITRSITTLQPSFKDVINFVPMRGDFARGILASVYTDCSLSSCEAKKLYSEYYTDARFTHLIEGEVDMKQVVNTNKALLSVEKYGDKLHIVIAIDNLLKGASGQAVQNMNLMMGWDQTEGLRLKPSAF